MAKLNESDLAGLLASACSHVGEHDSWEGSIRWTWPVLDAAGGEVGSADDYEVQAFVRTGNKNGQGEAMVILATPNGPFDDAHQTPAGPDADKLKLIASIASGFAAFEYKEWFDAVQSISDGQAEIRVNGNMIEAWG